jgi:hypothetical protein
MQNLFGYDIIKELGKGKTGISYLVTKNDNFFCSQSNE